MYISGEPQMLWIESIYNALSSVGTKHISVKRFVRGNQYLSINQCTYMYEWM